MDTREGRWPPAIPFDRTYTEAERRALDAGAPSPDAAERAARSTRKEKRR